MGDPKFSNPKTNKTLKVNLGGDGSHSCKRISDFMIFIKVIIATWKIMGIMLHTQVILRGTFPIRVQYSYSSVIPSWARNNPDESHFCDVSSDHGWGLQDCPQLQVRVTSDTLY